MAYVFGQRCGTARRYAQEVCVDLDCGGGGAVHMAANGDVRISRPPVGPSSDLSRAELVGVSASAIADEARSAPRAIRLLSDRGVHTRDPHRTRLGTTTHGAPVDGGRLPPRWGTRRIRLV